jgi:hypothetical protein
VPDHGITPAAENRQFDDKLAIVPLFCPRLARRHDGAVRIAQLDRAEQRFHALSKCQDNLTWRGWNLAANERAARSSMACAKPGDAKDSIASVGRVILRISETNPRSASRRKARHSASFARFAALDICSAEDAFGAGRVEVAFLRRQPDGLVDGGCPRVGFLHNRDVVFL